jgi:hypothetical protein
VAGHIRGLRVRATTRRRVQPQPPAPFVSSGTPANIAMLADVDIRLACAARAALLRREPARARGLRLAGRRPRALPRGSPGPLAAEEATRSSAWRP